MFTQPADFLVFNLLVTDQLPRGVALQRCLLEYDRMKVRGKITNHDLKFASTTAKSMILREFFRDYLYNQDYGYFHEGPVHISESLQFKQMFGESAYV